MNPKNEHNELDLSKEAPTLSSLKPKDSKGALEVPDGYFDNLSDRVMDRVRSSNDASDKDAQTVVRNIWPVKKIIGWSVPVAAAVAIFFWVSGNEEPSPTDYSGEIALVEELNDIDMDVEDLTAKEMFDEFTSSSLEEEEDLTLLDDVDSEMLVASLDSDDMFDEFFEDDFSDLIGEEQSSGSEDYTEQDIELIEDYFSDGEDAFSFDILAE